MYKYPVGVSLAVLGVVAGPLRAAVISLGSFDPNIGTFPESVLVAGPNGDLYGTTTASGFNSSGAVFEVNPTTKTLAYPGPFHDTNGAGAQGAPLLVNGLLYGTTSAGGGPDNQGTIYSFDPVTKSITTLHVFDHTGEGIGPATQLVSDGQGNLYGTTLNSASNNFGTVFKYSIVTKTFTNIGTFDGVNGEFPFSNLVSDGHGNFYGTTEGQVSSGTYGTIYKLSGTSIIKLASFQSFDGATPSGNIVLSQGHIYGTTMTGGPSGDGTVFDFNLATNTITSLYAFSGADGAEPQGGVIIDALGNLYGPTLRGGPGNYGTLFKLDPATHLLTTLATFNPILGVDDNAEPQGGLYADATGNLFGTTTGWNAWGGPIEITNSGFAVPEPANTALLAICGISVGIRRRRGR